MKSGFLKTCLALSLLWTADAAALDFTPCADAASQPGAARPGLQGSLCAVRTVPAIYDGASPERLSLFVRKFAAVGASRGSVWAIAGGPGESGASLYPFVDVLRRSFPGFDILVPDHRGTGLSSRVCPAEEAIDSPGGTALAGAEWGSCFGRIAERPELARQFTLTHAAHDLAGLVEQEARSKPVFIVGVSYGTQLVLRTLQLKRLPVTGIVLDSLVPSQEDARWDLSRRSHVVDDVGRQVLARCDADAACAAAMGEPLDTVYRRVLAKADPLLLAEVPGKDLRHFAGALLDMPALRTRIPYLLKDLDRGRTDELRALLAALPAIRASLGGYAQTPPSLPLTGIISNSESDLRPGRSEAELARDEAPLLFRSPLPALLASSTLPRYPRDAWFGRDPARLPPTLVLQGTLDPKTHYDGARRHAGALRERGPLGLVAVRGAPHFILWTAPGCFERHVSAFAAGRKPVDAECMMY